MLARQANFISDFLNGNGQWIAELLPVAAIVLGALAFAWAFIFLTVRAAVRSALKASAPAYQLGTNAAPRKPKEAKPQRTHARYGPTEIKPAPSPRDWSPSSLD